MKNLPRAFGTLGHAGDTGSAAANLAGSEMMATGIEAFKLGIAGFLVPFAFVYQPALLLQGSWLEIAKAFALTGIGAAAAVEGAELGFEALAGGILRRGLRWRGLLLLRDRLRRQQWLRERGSGKQGGEQNKTHKGRDPNLEFSANSPRLIETWLKLAAKNHHEDTDT